VFFLWIFPNLFLLPFRYFWHIYEGVLTSPQPDPLPDVVGLNR